MRLHDAWNCARTVELAQRTTIKAECPQPSKRRWWLAASLDGHHGGYAGANGFREVSSAPFAPRSPSTPPG
ncbi:hypothetical protein ACWCXX_19745 [Streptomyces sp. NPDC001732]